MLNPKKVKEFKEYAREEYIESLIAEQVTEIKLVKKTDGSFVQIGIRPLIDDDFLIMPNFDSRLPGVGRHVAIGEEDFLIKKILENEEIKKIEFEEDIKEFPKYVFGENNTVILLSTKFFVEVSTKLINRIDYEEKGQRLDRRYKLIFIPERVLGNKIIILDKQAILWEKEIFEDKVTGTKENLDISIKTVPGGKVDIILRSVNKITIMDPKLIKILEVGDGKKN